MRESRAALVAMRDVYVSHPAAPTVKNVPIDASAHARVNHFVNRRKVVVSEMFYNYLAETLYEQWRAPSGSSQAWQCPEKGTVSSAQAYFKKCVQKG